MNKHTHNNANIPIPRAFNPNGANGNGPNPVAKTPNQNSSGTNGNGPNLNPAAGNNNS